MEKCTKTYLTSNIMNVELDKLYNESQIKPETILKDVWYFYETEKNVLCFKCKKFENNKVLISYISFKKLLKSRNQVISKKSKTNKVIPIEDFKLAFDVNNMKEWKFGNKEYIENFI